MKERESYKLLLPQELYRQIEDIYDTLLEMQKEAAGIAHESKVTDTTAHLEDVLVATEKATHNILDCATSIQAAAEKDCSTADIRAEIGEYVINIYEACNFQDITGQRIKKVLKNLSVLEEHIKRLALSAQINNLVAEAEIKKEEPSLLNGPQLTADAPSQDDIDKLFSSF